MRIYQVLFSRTGFDNLFCDVCRENVYASSREMAIFKMKKKYGKSIDIRLVRC